MSQSEELTAVLGLVVEIIILIVKYCLVSLRATYDAFFTPERSVEGDIVLITGTGHGIGQEIAIQYASLGATVVCWDINEELNKETVDLIKAQGGKVFGYTVDVTNREKVLEAGAQVLKEVGTITILICNAGIMPQRNLLKQTENDIRKVFDVNVLSHFWMFQAFLPKMIENNCGHIVGISSMAGLLGFQNLVSYCSSKFAVRGTFEGLFEELRANSNGNSKIKLTTIFPYAVETGLFKKASIRFEKLMPIIQPEEAAASIISAQRKGKQEASIPRFLFHFQRILRIFPNDANVLVKTFLRANIESDE